MVSSSSSTASSKDQRSKNNGASLSHHQSSKRSKIVVSLNQEEDTTANPVDSKKGTTKDPVLTTTTTGTTEITTEAVSSSSSTSNIPPEKNLSTTSPSGTDDDELDTDDDDDNDTNDDEIDSGDFYESLSDNEDDILPTDDKETNWGKILRKNSKSSGASLNNSETSTSSKGKKRVRNEEPTSVTATSENLSLVKTSTTTVPTVTDTENRRFTRSRLNKDRNKNSQNPSNMEETMDPDVEARLYIRQNLSSLVETFNEPSKRRQRYRGMDTSYGGKHSIKPKTKVFKTTVLPVSSVSPSLSSTGAVASTSSNIPKPSNSSSITANVNTQLPSSNGNAVPFMVNPVFNPTNFDTMGSNNYPPPSFHPSGLMNNMNGMQRPFFHPGMMYGPMFPPFQAPSSSSTFYIQPTMGTSSSSSPRGSSIMNTNPSSNVERNEFSEPFSFNYFPSRYNLPMGSLPYPGFHNRSSHDGNNSFESLSMQPNHMLNAISLSSSSNNNFISNNNPNHSNNNYNNGYSAIPSSSMFSDVFTNSAMNQSSTSDNNQHPNTNNTTFSTLLSSTSPMYPNAENNSGTNGSGTSNISNFVPIHRPTGLRSAEVLLISPESIVPSTTTLPNLSLDSPGVVLMNESATIVSTKNDNNDYSADICDSDKSHRILSTSTEYVMNNVSMDSTAVETTTTTV